MKLEAFIENADYFNDTSCVDKFLNGSITKVRNQAIKSLNVLRSKANNSKDVKERNILLEALSSLKETVNMYIVIVQSIFEHKSGKLFNILKSRGIDYKEKYNLTQIE